jgi:hypothetical protein
MMFQVTCCYCCLATLKQMIRPSARLDISQLVDAVRQVTPLSVFLRTRCSWQGALHTRTRIYIFANVRAHMPVTIAVRWII